MFGQDRVLSCRVVSGKWHNYRAMLCHVFEVPANLTILGRIKYSRLHYPPQNWKIGINECLNDGNQPAFMNTNPAYLLSTQEACCKFFFSWTVNTCLGVYNVGTSKWYIDWYKEGDGACVMDCPISNGGSCGGLANSWDYIWGSKSECCAAQKPWDTSCLSK